jgi:hypothetical protein
MDGCNDAGPTRIERLERLRDAFASAGIDVRFDVVPGVTHDDRGIHDAAEAFLIERVRGRIAQSGGSADTASLSSRT